MSEAEKEGYKQRASQAKAEYDQLNPKQAKEVCCEKQKLLSQL